MKVLLAIGGIDREFVTEHTLGFDGLLEELEDESFDRARASSRARPRPTWSGSRACTRDAKRAVLVWSMGITQHAARRRQRAGDRQPRRSRAATSAARARDSCRSAGTPACRAARRWAATRPRSRAVSPITRAQRRDSARRSGASRCRRTAGSTAARDGRRRARAATSTCSGRAAATSSTCCPRPTSRAPRSARTPLRVHQDIVLTHQMLVEPGETVVLLPAATRYEQAGGGTSTTTERRVAFSPEIAGPTVGEARSEWRDLRSTSRAGCIPTAPRVSAATPRDEIRAEIARVVPAYAGIETLRDDRRRDPSRRRAPVRRRRLPDARRHGPASASSCRRRPTFRDGRFVLSTRRGKQFNSMVWKDVDPLTGAGRDALLRCPTPTRQRSASTTGDAVLVRSRVRRDARAGARRADPARQRAGVLPRGQRAARRRTGATRSPACPTTTPSSRWSRSRDTRRRCSSCSTHGRSRSRVAVAGDRPRHACATGPSGPVSTRSTWSPTRPRARCCATRRCAIVSEESGVHERVERVDHGRARSRSTARRTARAASPTGRPRSARVDGDECCSPRSSSTRRPDARPRPSGAKARTATACRSARRSRRASRTP